MEFKFDNILLPDSNVNEPASHGFVRYRIQPQDTLALGDSIKNFAAIYFDFNDPVITNTAVTEVVSPTGVGGLQVSGSGFQVYPNPAAEEIVIITALPRGEKPEVVIYDSMGKVQLQTVATQSQARIGIGALAQGLYLVEVKGREGALRGKFVKQ
jgi:hypothetical protein